MLTGSIRYDNSILSVSLSDGLSLSAISTNISTRCLGRVFAHNRKRRETWFLLKMHFRPATMNEPWSALHIWTSFKSIQRHRWVSTIQIKLGSVSMMTHFAGSNGEGHYIKPRHVLQVLISHMQKNNGQFLSASSFRCSHVFSCSTSGGQACHFDRLHFLGRRLGSSCVDRKDGKSSRQSPLCSGSLTKITKL